jgi:hypothetical protein
MAGEGRADGDRRRGVQPWWWALQVRVLIIATVWVPSGT